MKNRVKVNTEVYTTAGTFSLKRANRAINMLFRGQRSHKNENCAGTPMFYTTILIVKNLNY